jgi:L-lactate permease
VLLSGQSLQYRQYSDIKAFTAILLSFTWPFLPHFLLDYSKRREAAIAYFVVSVVAVVFAWGNTTKLISAASGVLVALLSVRATLCYARLCGKKKKEQAFNQEDTPDQKPVR